MQSRATRTISRLQAGAWVWGGERWAEGGEACDHGCLVGPLMLLGGNVRDSGQDMYDETILRGPWAAFGRWEACCVLVLLCLGCAAYRECCVLDALCTGCVEYWAYAVYLACCVLDMFCLDCVVYCVCCVLDVLRFVYRMYCVLGTGLVVHCV